MKDNLIFYKNEKKTLSVKNQCTLCGNIHNLENGCTNSSLIKNINILNKKNILLCQECLKMLFYVISGKKNKYLEKRTTYDFYINIMNN